MPQQYQTFTLSKDLNSVITAGMVGIILEVFDDDTFEVEFVKPDGTSYEYDRQSAFTVHSDMLE